MSDYPDLISYGYQVERELGRNREGGRITWKGIKINTQTDVVIKQFCFAQANSSWSGYQAYQKEIEVLQTLDYPYIPRYLDHIETQDGFCIIQEYISATNCVNHRQLSVAKVMKIAANVLDILVYLQQQHPPILHRDIKPENILLDEALNAYLIDFGFSSLGSHETSSSSFFKGTPGFIAPEQIIKPTTASDIYSLGVTLVYLLTSIDLVDIRDTASADDPYQLKLNLLLPNLERQFREWLTKMTNAKVSQRFPDAVTARDALVKLVQVVQVNSSTALINNPITAINTPLNLSIKSKAVVGTVAISGLTTVAIWSLNFTDGRVESSIINVAIAIIAAVAVGITQLGAVSLASWDRQSSLQGIVLSVIIPTILVSTSGLIWGIEEAVIISAAIAITEIAVLSYCWWQLPLWKPNSLIRVGSWLGAIAFAIVLGLRII